MLAPRTGTSRAAGVEAQHGAELAAALVNGEAGAVALAGAGGEGLDGLGGAKLTIVAGDTKSTPRAGPPRRPAWSPRSGSWGWSAPTTPR